MLQCRDCGQCNHINHNNFRGYEPIITSQEVWLDSTDGETVDWGDYGDSDSNGDIEAYCPHCHGSDIDWDSEITEEEAIALREEYERRMFLSRLELEELTKQLKKEEEANDPNREWDIEKNITTR